MLVNSGKVKAWMQGEARRRCNDFWGMQSGKEASPSSEDGLDCS